MLEPNTDLIPERDLAFYAEVSFARVDLKKGKYTLHDLHVMMQWIRDWNYHYKQLMPKRVWRYG